MATFAHTSTGRGNPHALLGRRVSTNRLSIVDRLASRSVAGHGLRIYVHQHYGYRLHFECRGNNTDTVSSRFMERRFAMAGEAQTFCTELCNYGLGLCTGVYEGFNMLLHVRAPRCLREPIMQSQKYLSYPKWWLKAMQEHCNENRCQCRRIYSSYTLEWRNN